MKSTHFARDHKIGSACAVCQSKTTSVPNYWAPQQCFRRESGWDAKKKKKNGIRGIVASGDLIVKF